MKNVKVTPAILRQMKEKGDKNTLIPVYDYPFARILDECGVDVLLVGDSLGKQVLGRKENLSVTVDEMIYHTQAVARAAERAMVVTDMPFMSYEVNIDEAKRNAGRIIKEGGADAVKLEGGMEVVETIAALVKAGIPVMGHIGPVPQLAHQGILPVRGSTKEDREVILRDAKAIEEAGAFMLGLVMVYPDVAAEISRMLKIPTSGFGSGPNCDGSSQFLYEMIGLNSGPYTPFAKQYANVRQVTIDATKQCIKEIKEGLFPASK
jgi:3-methyl-2-oxobutanoate hydroxymethyltransferase